MAVPREMRLGLGLGLRHHVCTCGVKEQVMAVPREMTRTEETTGRVGVSMRATYAVNIMIT